MTKSKSSRKSPSAQTAPSSAPRLRTVDAIPLAALLALGMLLMARSGFSRGAELMPWPDGLEYAAVAVNIDRGVGPVLHFGGYSYPPRYTDGYPLILAAAYPIVGKKPERLCLATVAMGLLAIAALYILALRMFGRPSAFVAGLMLATSPLFLTYSTLVMSDVPALAITILGGLALFYATDSEDLAVGRAAMLVSAGLFGLAAGLAVIIRPTNVVMLAGLVAAVAMVRPRAEAGAGTARRWIAPGAAFAAGFALFPLWQGWENLRHLGGAFRSGYVFWVPEVYARFASTFGLRFLTGPTMPRNPHGNLVSYLFAILGIDGMLGDPGVPRYIVYPFAAAVFAAIGIVSALRRPQSRATRRVTYFGLGFLAALLIIYSIYFFTEIAFILPALFIVFAAAGYGVVVANRRMNQAAGARRRSRRELAMMAGVFALDVLLAVSILIESSVRLAARPAPSRMVPALVSMRQSLGRGSTVVSNVSLQFLKLYLAGEGTRFVGLNSYDPGARFTDYHLHRLYVKRAGGWTGPVPPVVFDGARMDEAEVASLKKTAGAGRPVYLLLAAPETPEYAELMGDEMSRLAASFEVEPVRNETVAVLYRLIPR